MRRWKHGFDFAASAWVELDVFSNRLRDFAICPAAARSTVYVQPEAR
jgi:hypothetical protein